eukprot:CAMPEP_0114505042 /NCGR_PEP_ID=MMETSP0109-20121206/10627_1 /TAXON_ID=29199 /ORGANISM="Chlorarachnion reptans, Strain CCCM449" /LENGTH=68 /DNA_ID=CAMNT_0001683425 /DNA_START=1218 /DNA_END=1421 /DNA_ORIENTATION=-
MEDLLSSLASEIKDIEKKDEEDTRVEIHRQQTKIAETKDCFAALPSQDKDSAALHQAVVEGFKRSMTS